jgi:hypothetical protein
MQTDWKQMQNANVIYFFSLLLITPSAQGCDVVIARNACRAIAGKIIVGKELTGVERKDYDRELK